MPASKFTKTKLTVIALVEVLAFIVVMAAICHLTSGRWNYWQAWVFIAILVVAVLAILVYLIRNDPELLARRMQYREKETKQKKIVNISGILITIAFVLPGLDIRFGWSHVPAAVVVLAEIGILAAFALFFWTMRENTYLSRIVEVQSEQKVITSGPYSVVRHPMYVAVILMCIATPIALGSYWMVIPAILTIPIMTARILNEEKLLQENLVGYTEYMGKTRYRLIPGIW